MSTECRRTTRRGVTVSVPQEEDARRRLARLLHPSVALEPVRDADDLHDVDQDAELWSLLPERPSSAGGSLPGALAC